MRWCSLLLALIWMGSSTQAEDIRFPEDSGIVDVTKPPFNARGDGVTDDTAALQLAVSKVDRLVYLPNGTYLISDTLEWGGRQCRIILQGQSEDKTIIRLVDRAAKFQDAAQPRPMINTGTSPPQRFRNGIRNLTVDAGRENPGAIGVRFYANNQGGMHHVTIQSADSQGVTGLDMSHAGDQGPCLVSRVNIRGFDYGVKCKAWTTSVVFEHLRLRGQNRFGIHNSGLNLSIRGLDSENRGPAMFNGQHGLVTLIDSTLRGIDKARKTSAITNQGPMYIRRLATPGYQTAITGEAKGYAPAPIGTDIAEWSSQPVASKIDTSPMPRALDLPIKETPEIPWDNLEEWISVKAFPPKEIQLTDEKGKLKKTLDYTEAIQRAIDSGKQTIYFPHGEYPVYGVIRVRGNVRRIIGCESKFTQPIGKTAARFIVEDGTSPVVTIERFDWTYSQVEIEHSTKRSLVISSLAVGMIATRQGAGDLFLEDICGTYGRELLKIDHTAVWARQLNPESSTGTGVINDGGTLWLFGMKTEGDATKVFTRGGGKSEITAFIYANSGRLKQPLFINEESSMSVVMSESVLRKMPFQELIVETRHGKKNIVKRSEKLPPERGTVWPLRVSYPE